MTRGRNVDDDFPIVTYPPMMPDALQISLLLRAESKVPLAANPRGRIFTERIAEKKYEKKRIIKKSVRGEEEKMEFMCAKGCFSQRVLETIDFLLPPSDFSPAKKKTSRR